VTARLFGSIAGKSSASSFPRTDVVAEKSGTSVSVVAAVAAATAPPESSRRAVLLAVSIIARAMVALTMASRPRAAVVAPPARSGAPAAMPKSLCSRA